MAAPARNPLIDHLTGLVNVGRNVSRVRRDGARVVFETDEGDSFCDVSNLDPFARTSAWNALVMLVEMRIEVER